MRTNKFLAVGLLATMILGSCSNNEDPANTPGTDEIQLNAGIGVQTRGEGVISPDYEKDLKVAFARYDAVNTAAWAGLDLKAVRIGGSGATPIAFEMTQTYDLVTPTNSTTLIGYYPRPGVTPSSTGTDPFNAQYTIDGSTDIMATNPVNGSKSSPINKPITFNHQLAQLQFRCVGSSEAIAKWQDIAIKVKSVPTALSLKINKGANPLLTADTPGVDGDLDVVGGSKTPQSPDEANPTTGYVMLYPVANLGTEGKALSVEITGLYDSNSQTKTVSIKNIAGGLQKGVSHLITLIFTVDGDISASATADIAPWNPGNAGSSVVTPN